MLQQVMRVSWRCVSPVIKWTEPVTEVRTLDQMPGPSAVRFIWDLLANRGLSRLHELQVNPHAHTHKHTPEHT